MKTNSQKNNKINGEFVLLLSLLYALRIEVEVGQKIHTSCAVEELDLTKKLILNI